VVLISSELASRRLASGFNGDNDILSRVRIFLATSNQSKIAEVRLIMGERFIEVAGLTDSASTNEIETGATFAENALLKARYYHKISGLPTVSDDSGLEVEALGGAPGIYSARFAGPGAGDGDRIAGLLYEMKGVPNHLRGAQFTCAAAIVWDGGERVFEDHVQGLILESARGTRGFGYDPIFFYEPLGKTFAELTPSEKADVSHRGRAFRRLAAWLSDSGALDTSRSGDRIGTTAD
jgi:XTP/dITP diphosphohydrolase